VLRPRGLRDGDTLPATVLSVDQRAIRNPVAEPLLEADNAAHGLETDHRELAQAIVGGKARRRWESIPQRLARSMAFAGEPVSLEILEAEHALRTMPPVTSTPPAAD